MSALKSYDTQTDVMLSVVHRTIMFVPMIFLFLSFFKQSEKFDSMT